MSAAQTLDIPSIRALVEALDLGETFARAQRFDPDETPKTVPLVALRSIRLSTQATVFRVSERTGNRYSIESGEFITSSRDLMMVLTVTRVG